MDSLSLSLKKLLVAPNSIITSPCSWAFVIFIASLLLQWLLLPFILLLLLFCCLQLLRDFTFCCYPISRVYYFVVFCSLVGFGTFTVPLLSLVFTHSTTFATFTTFAIVATAADFATSAILPFCCFSMFCHFY